MYYRRVNRGLSFTKPGVYAFGLVLLIGMIAVTTGINGLYVFLSAGLGGFIVSGMLSELAMNSCTVRSVNAALADAETPFSVRFTVENSSGWFSVFGIQSLFLLTPPRFRLISRPTDSVAGARLPRVAPGETLACLAPVKGMPRGEYRRILAMQMTTFPFGILEKFKLVDIPASLVVAPRLDTAFHDELRALVQAKLRALAAEREFYSHRSYAALDPLRDVDWKKSANREPSAWVVRQYRAPAGNGTVRVEAPYAYAASLPDAAAYETYLARVRTALKVLEEAGRAYVLDFQLASGRTLSGYDACLMVLAAAPRYAERSQLHHVLSQRVLDLDGAKEAAGGNSRLALTLTGCDWTGA